MKIGERIYLSSPHMSDGGYEKHYLNEAFATNWIAPLGRNVNEFEKELATKVGSRARGTGISSQ
jgi:dTDP-4-amino-4,6-dideoxygalactose transaminase